MERRPRPNQQGPDLQRFPLDNFTSASGVSSGGVSIRHDDTLGESPLGADRTERRSKLDGSRLATRSAMKMNPRNTALYGAALSTITACAPIELPPPAPPPKEMPAVRTELGPPAPGREHVVLDTPGEQARVSEVTSTSETVTRRGYVASTEHDRPLCLTPCVVDLKLGLHDLSFQSTTDERRASDVELQVQGDPMVVRHTMAETRTPHPAVQGVARASLLTGVVGLGAGIPITLAGVFLRSSGMPSTRFVDGAPMESQTPGPQGVETAGLVTLGVSAGLVLVGAVTGYFARDEYTPGATTEWTVPRTDARASTPATGAKSPLFVF
jgi:hypothetical protein